MIIQSITLKNFRQFRGEHTIEFSTDNNQNVTVVMGDNGSGKTTLEQAFIWCLYNKTYFQNSQLINIELGNSMPVGDSVKVTVRLCILYDGRKYVVERTHFLTKKTMTSFNKPVEKFNIRFQNENGDWEEILEAQKNLTVENMLPEKLAGFFFFDGEHIESMSDELLKKKRSDNFKQAVRALVGLNAWQAAMDHFGPQTRLRSVTGKFISEIQDTGDGDKETLDEDIDKQQRLLLNYEEKRVKAEADYQDADKRIRNIELKLQAMQGDIENRRKYGEFIHKIKQEELQQNIDQEETIKLFSKNVFFVLLLPIMKQALEELRSTEKIDKGIPHMHADTIKFLLDRGHCICGNDLKHNQNCINRMHDLMESLPPNNLGTMIGNFVKDIKIYARNADSLGENFLAQGSRYLQHDSKIEEYEAEKKVLDSKLEDISEVSSLNQRKKELETQKQKLRADVRQYDEACGGAKRELARLEKKRETIISSDKRNIVNRLYYTYAKAAYDKLEKEYNIKVNQTREDLENVINEIFADIYDSQIGIEIKEDYSIKTYLQNNIPGADNLEKNTAQSYAVIFAFIAGIIKMHMENKGMQEDGLPMVMDAPLSAFDKDRIKRICEALPKIAQQIIIFIKDTDGDIAEEHMSKVIGKKWLIQADSQTSSRIVERG